MCYRVQGQSVSNGSIIIAIVQILFNQTSQLKKEEKENMIIKWVQIVLKMVEKKKTFMG